jgi:hypothetical protein
LVMQTPILLDQNYHKQDKQEKSIIIPKIIKNQTC